jgi:predicted nucleic acid-binding protein
MQSLVNEDPGMFVWWGAGIECVSALARIERLEALGQQAIAHAYQRLQDLASGWQEVEPSELVRDTAVRLLRVHPLRAADSLQLAAAFVGAERHPSGLEFVTLDDRLAAAARKEGFVVIAA